MFHITLMDLNIVQLAVTASGTLILPALALYVNAQIDKRFSSFEVKLVEKLGEYQKAQFERTKESDMVHANLDKRIAIVENGHASITNRLDALVNELRSESVQREQSNSGGHRKPAGGHA